MYLVSVDPMDRSLVCYFAIFGIGWKLESTIVRKLEVLGLVYSPIVVSANLQKQAEFPGASHLSSLVA